jgi:lipopolysaccharide transport system ATP-binding protein
MNPTSGRKVVHGSLSALIEVGAGFHPDLTGRENVFLNGTILGMKRAEIRGKLDEIVEFSGLADFIDTPVKRYSSGMYARLGFSIACHVSPDVLVVDEVLSVGDWAFQNKSMEKMKTILNGGATVIFVSHNMKAITGLCERVMFLDHGKVQMIGGASEVVDTYIKRATAQAQDVQIEGKEAYIEQVALRNGSGAEVTVFEPGEKATVDVDVSNVDCSQPLAVAIGLRDETYNLFFYIDSARLDPKSMVLAAGEAKKLTFELDMHLAPGSYFLNVALTRPDIDKLVDHKAPAVNFVVQSDVDVRGVANLYPRLSVT